MNGWFQDPDEITRFSKELEVNPDDDEITRLRKELEAWKWAHSQIVHGYIDLLERIRKVDEALVTAHDKNLRHLEQPTN